VEVTGVQGNGSSSGASLRGKLVNRTGSTLEVDVALREPLYFDNAGSAQNMVATQVYESGGGYYVEGSRRFLELRPNASLPVLFIAYCADFESDNPGELDRLNVAVMPGDIAWAASRIAEYEALNPDTDTVVSAQLALWLSQGETPQEIQQKFSFTQSELDIARAILR
jgi:hypothetical protein